ncbi:hypothetical protein ACEN88_33035 [Massilia sp. CT11-108]
MSPPDSLSRVLVDGVAVAVPCGVTVVAALGGAPPAPRGAGGCRGG